MAGRRGCMNSLWSGSERVRFGERLKASLAGILELDLLRFRHLEMVEGALGRRDGTERQRGSSEWISADGTARSRRQQVQSVSDSGLTCFSSFGDGVDSRWSTLSWDIPSDPLSPPTPDLSGAAQLDCDSRPSSGFYSVSGSSLSDSCCSVCSEGVPGALGGAAGVRSSWGPVDCRPHSADHSASHWRECRQQPTQGATEEKGERRPVSTGDLEVSGLLFLSDLCSGLGQSQLASFYPNASNQPRLQLDPKFCSDLVSRKTKEVYPYPSPLHAVALQSPLFTSPQDPTPPNANPNLPPTSEANRHDEPKTEDSVLTRQQAPSHLSQLDQYISKLVLQYHSRATTDLSSRPGSRKWSSGPARGSSQSLTSFDSHSTSSTMTVTQRKSFFGNSGSIGASGNGKGGGSCRNSINLGNLSSLNGENLNLSFQLNLNLNLNPNLNSNLSLDSKNVKEVMGSYGYLGNETLARTPPPTSSTTSTSSTWRGRKRISTCLQTVSHRGSLEIKGTGFSPQGFSRSMDWSGISQELEENPAKLCEGSPKISENSARVCEISRVSGLPRSVVVGLLEEGVELDEDCFRTEAERGEAFPDGTPATSPSPYSHSQLPESDQSACHSSASLQSHSTIYPHSELDLHLPPHCPSSFSDGLSTPSAHGQAVHAARQSTPTAHFDCHPSALAHPLPHPLSHLQTPSPPGSPADSQLSAHSARPAAHSPSLSQSRSPFLPAPLSVFHRDSPSQTSLPRFRVHRSPLEGDWRPRGGSLRQESGAGWESGGRGWRRAEGERLYQGKHASRELVRASTVSSFAGRESCNRWEEEAEGDLSGTAKRGTSFRKRLEGLFGGKEKERGVGSKRDGGRQNTSSEKSCSSVKKGKTEEEGEQENPSKHKGRGWSSRNSGVRPAGGLFRSESQGVLDRRFHKQSSKERRQQWVSSLEIARSGMEYTSQGLSLERARAFGGGGEDERLSSTASLFHLSRSQSPEGSCLSLSPLSSPSLSPPPPPARMTRSRSFRDLGRRVFGSVKPFSFKTQSLRK
ncbi:uncharacterized protein si:ch211-168f7.5 [Anguilla rostrata]|uniref:uncharacterized protein si:ch211-168f7.5 n=1 Tax=Anguilla rostrata TaxID=7938 RepID=UPI0030CE3A99